MGHKEIIITVVTLVVLGVICFRSLVKKTDEVDFEHRDEKTNLYLKEHLHLIFEAEKFVNNHFSFVWFNPIIKDKHGQIVEPFEEFHKILSEKIKTVENTNALIFDLENETFLVFFKSDDDDEIKKLIKVTNFIFKDEIIYDEKSYNVKFQTGVAKYPEDGFNMDQLLEEATGIKEN